MMAFSITSSVLPDEIYTLTVRATDLAGNVSAESVGLPIEMIQQPSCTVNNNRYSLNKDQYPNNHRNSRGRKHSRGS